MPDDDVRQPGTGAIAARPEGEPHLTFHTLLADTLYEMDADEAAGAPEPDAADLLRDDAISALRTTSSAPLVRPFHHAYLTPMGTPAIPSHPTRLDIRS